MPDATLSDTFVMLCDWRGRCVWVSTDLPRLKVGEFVWEHLSGQSRKEVKSAPRAWSRCARKSISTWSIGTIGDFTAGSGRSILPTSRCASSACSLRFDPSKLAKRERAVLELLAQGIETKTIARKLDLSVSTVHTHMKRAREKLGLRSVESLISFAARYCYPASLALESRASNLAVPTLPVAIGRSKKRLAPGVVLRTPGGKSSL